jgi:hypothetical protein
VVNLQIRIINPGEMGKGVKILIYLQMMRCLSHVKFAIKAMPECDSEHWDDGDDINELVDNMLRKCYDDTDDGHKEYMKDMKPNWDEWLKEEIDDDLFERIGAKGMKSSDNEEMLKSCYKDYFSYGRSLR